MKFKFILFILIFFCFNIVSFSNTPITFSKYDYGASSQNWAVSSDNNGIIYIANSEGLLQYDGKTWKLHKLPDNGKIYALYIDINNRIYTGGFEEFGYWEVTSTGALKYFSIRDSIDDFEFHNHTIWKILEIDNKVYFYSWGAVFKYENSHVSALKDSHGFYTLINVDNKLLGQKFEKDIYQINDTIISLEFSDEKLYGAALRNSISVNPDKWLVASHLQGLFSYENDNFRIWNSEINSVLKDKRINSMTSDQDYYYFGTDNFGLYISDKQGNLINHIDKDLGLRSNTIQDMFIDRYNNLWLTHNDGISFIELKSPFKTISYHDNDFGVVVSGAYFENKLFLGTSLGVYYKEVEKEKIKDIKLDDFVFLEGSEGMVYSLEVADNQLLIGSHFGSYVYYNNKLQKISDIEGAYNFRQIENEGEKYLIQSTYSNLVLYKKNNFGIWNKLKVFKSYNEPSRFCEIDYKGNIWLSHNDRNRIYKVRVNFNDLTISDVKEFRGDKELCFDVNTKIFKVESSILTPACDGLYAYDYINDSLILVEKLNSGLGTFTSPIQVKKAGNNTYWLISGSNVGLFGVEDNKASQRLNFSFNRENLSLVESYENVVTIDANLHLILLNKGIAVYDAKSFQKKELISPLSFRSISSKNMQLDLNPTETPQIDYHNNQISFEFSPNYYPGERVKFSYILEGADNKWSEYSTNNSAKYTRLPWGEYNFIVKALDPMGKEINQNSYRFIVTTPVYATWYAYVFYFLSVIAVILISHQQIKKKQEELIRLEQDKSEILRVELENKSLKAEVEYKSKDLATTTLASIKKNEALNKVMQVVEKQKEVLGERFPKKNYNEIVKAIKSNISDNKDWEIFVDHFDRAHDNFFTKLKNSYPGLSASDLRLCAFLQLQLSSKEIAPLMSISVRGVESHRYRLRKKMNLSQDENLSDVLNMYY